MASEKLDDIDLPPEIPVFPLNGVLLLPGGQLPLNIFEERYIAMVEDALKTPHRLIGMVQPRDSEIVTGKDNTPVFDIGCAGRLTSFEETDDGRYLVTLTGLCRFRIAQELNPEKNYRRGAVDWSPYKEDLQRESSLDLDRERLKQLLADYFKMNGISCDWDAIDGAVDQKLVTCLSMICPFDPQEKQALLEAACCRTRADMFLMMLEMAIREKGERSGGCH